MSEPAPSPRLPSAPSTTLDVNVDEGARAELARRIGTLEKRTRAEVVVVLRPASGSYRDLDLGLGLAVAFVTLVAIVYSPWAFPYDGLVPAVSVATLIGILVGSRSECVRRRLAGADRLGCQAREGAAAAFARHQVWATRERTGLLVYWSRLERRLEIMADVGLQGRLPAHAFHQIVHDFHRGLAGCDVGAALGTVLDRLGDLLAPHFPPRDDDPNELPDAPVVEA